MPSRRPEAADRAVKGARRHRGVALFMMGLMALSCIGLVAAFVYSSGMLEGDKRTAQVGQDIAVSNKSVNMMEPKVTGYDRKSQAYVLNAVSARQDENEPHVVHLDRVTADLELEKSGDTVRVTADRGIYDSEAETLRLEGNIRLQSTNGYTAELEEADIWMEEGRVESDRPVKVTTSSGSVVANGMEMWNNGNNIRFTNRARMRFTGGDKDSG